MRNWMQRPNFYLIRHGETDRNSSDPPSYRGGDDVPLNEEGMESAMALVNYLGYERLGQIVSSDLQRATATAEPLLFMSCCGYIDMNPNFRPLDVGKFTGLPKTERNKKALQHYIENPDELIPGSTETVSQFRSRNSEAFKQYACLSLSSEHPLVIVTHTSNVTCFYDEVKPDHGITPEGGDVIGPGGLMAVYVMGDKYECEILLRSEASAEGTPEAS